MLNPPRSAVEALERGGRSAVAPLDQAACPSTASTVSGASCWFFGANASIEGGITTMRSLSRPSQMKDWREKT